MKRAWPDESMPEGFDLDSCTGLFGGTFDPIHNGHLNLADHLVSTGAIDQVLFVPASTPPHKQRRRVSPGQHRYAMIELALAPFPKYVVSDFELLRAGPSYTIITARHFAMKTEGNLRLVLGMDSLRQLHTWHRAQELCEHFEFVIFRRPGYDMPDLNMLASAFGNDVAMKLLGSIIDGPVSAVSSSDVRRRLACGADVSGMLSGVVENYIRQHQLYPGVPSGSGKAK